MNNDVLIIIAVALGTILTRVLPFLIFNDAENLPPAISYLSKVLPYSIMAMLVVSWFSRNNCRFNYHYNSFIKGKYFIIDFSRHNYIYDLHSSDFCIKEV